MAFTLGARFYAWQTWHEVWRQHCGSLAAYFPAPLPEGRLAVLDLGIGPGVSGIGILQRRPDLWLVGLDFSADMLDLARHYLQISGHSFPLVHGDVTHLPFADDSFDIITHHSFLYLLANRDAGLAEMSRVLKPGGCYVMLEPNRRGSVLAVTKLSGPFRFRLSMFLWRIVSTGFGQFLREELVALLEKHGFVCERVEDTLFGMGFIVVAKKPQAAAPDSPKPTLLQGAPDAVS